MEESCHSEPIQTVATGDDANDARMVALQVQGMGCVNCGTRVRNSLLALDGVVSADVDCASVIRRILRAPFGVSISSSIPYLNEG